MSDLKVKLTSLLLFSVITLSPLISLAQEVAGNSIEDEVVQNLDYYLKYLGYQKYQKKKDFKKYQAAKEKYGFADSKERQDYKDAYNKYRLFKKDPLRNKGNIIYYEKYKRYLKYKNKFVPLKKYSRYSKYNKSEYDKYKSYGNATYRAGHDRYLAAMAALNATPPEFGEANLGAGPYGLGPVISVGLVEYTKQALQSEDFKVKVTNSAGDPIDYVIRNNTNAVIATIPAAAPITETHISYLSNQTFQIDNSIATPVTATGEVRIEAADPAAIADSVVDFNRPGTSNDQYREKIKLKYYDSPAADADRIWAINNLSLEHYVWGMGEITGTGDMKYNHVMTTSYRTYGYWKLRFSTKYAAQGFKVNATPGNQLYYGFVWEAAYPRIKQAAQETSGRVVMYQKEIAITPYSSWTDGRTRSFEERWGSKDYPWCQSVPDPYGKHATLSTAQLEAAGNHMVGLSAHGALSLARDHGWSYDRIIGYYFAAVRILKAY